MASSYIEMYQREDLAAATLSRTEQWRARFAHDAQKSRSLSWWNPFRRWHWSHAVTREQYRRFVQVEDPMATFPDEIFEGWVYRRVDELFGFSRAEQKRVFDRYLGRSCLDHQG